MKKSLLKKINGKTKRTITGMVLMLLILGGSFGSVSAQQACYIKFFNFCSDSQGCFPENVKYANTSETGRTLQATYDAALYINMGCTEITYNGGSYYCWSCYSSGGHSSECLYQDGSYTESIYPIDMLITSSWDVFCDDQDADNDGIHDYADACPLDPQNDIDGDGICGNVDTCPLDPQNDSDSDGVCGDVDPCPNSNPDDADDDSVCDNIDNCPGTVNPDQEDSDHDGIGDMCDDNPVECTTRFSFEPLMEENTYYTNESSKTEYAAAELVVFMFGNGACTILPYPSPDEVPCSGGCCTDYCGPVKIEACTDGTASTGIGSDLQYGTWNVGCGDSDEDGIPDVNDNCLLVANPSQDDCDEDGIGDVCDPEPGDDDDADGILNCTDICPLDPDNDGDGDGRCANNDNCPLISNSDQADTDSDGLGDVCDPYTGNDVDNDNIPDNEDNCKYTYNPAQVDSDDDAVGDDCDVCTIDCCQISWGGYGFSYYPGTPTISNYFITQEMSLTEAAMIEVYEDITGYPAEFEEFGINDDGRNCYTGWSLARSMFCCPYNSLTVCDDGTWTQDLEQHEVSCGYDGTWEVSCSDSDDDGILGVLDNCPMIANGPDAGSCYNYLTEEVGSTCTETCGDSWYTWCDDFQKDIDKDGSGDVCDNCPKDCNSQQLDADNDGIGDVCDETPGCGGCGQPDCEPEC